MKNCILLLALYLSLESAVFWAKNNELVATLCAGISLVIVIAIISIAIAKRWKRSERIRWPNFDDEPVVTTNNTLIGMNRDLCEDVRRQNEQDIRDFKASLKKEE